MFYTKNQHEGPDICYSDMYGNNQAAGLVGYVHVLSGVYPGRVEALVIHTTGAVGETHASSSVRSVCRSLMLADV